MAFCQDVYAHDEWCDSVMTLHEVSVTAIKQGHDGGLRSLPVASTSVSGEQLDRLNIVTMKGVSELAPNFYIPDYGSRMTSSIYVRGLGARIDQPVVGLNVDNVPYLNKDNYDFDLLDISGIEILRGPQSTLYGRNTMGGLVNIYTLSPMNYQGIRMMAEYGSGNTVRVGMSGYMKMSEKLGMSFSGYYTHTDGFFHNDFNGRKLDHETQGSARWKTVWRPSDNLTLENVASVQGNRQGGYPYAFAKTGTISYNDTCFYRRTAVTDGLTVGWRLTDDITLSSISSFQWLDDNMTLDQDFLPEPWFTLTQKRREWALTQDFICRGSHGRISWLGGLFGFYKHTVMDAPVTFGQTGIEKLILYYRNLYNPDYPARWDSDNFVLGSDFTASSAGAALYGQLSMDCGPVEWSAGMRVDVEHPVLDYHSECNTSYTVLDPSAPVQNNIFLTRPIEIDDRGHLSRNFLELLPKVAVTYRWDSTRPARNIYISISRGYKAGGFNTQMFSDVLQQRLMGFMGLASSYKVSDVVSYKPEYSWNYELGAHYVSDDSRLYLEGALFYIDCRDQQLTAFPEGTTTGRIMTNAGRTRSFGAEFTARWNPSARWNLSGSYGYTNAEFVDYMSGKEDYSGKRIPFAPSNTVFGGVTYTCPARGPWLESVSADVNLRGVGPIMWDDANTIEQKFYVLAGASLTFNHAHGSLMLWADNVTGTKYNTFYFVSVGNAFLQRGKPRRIGITMRVTI